MRGRGGRWIAARVAVAAALDDVGWIEVHVNPCEHFGTCRCGLRLDDVRSC